MAKRKLTRRQAWRAEKIQAERLARADKKAADIASVIEGSELGPEQTGRVITRYGAQADIEDEYHDIHRCLLRQNLPSLVCGDRVVWQAGQNQTGVVVAVEPRDSLLERPDADNQLKPVAANIILNAVVSPQPAHDPAPPVNKRAFSDNMKSTGNLSLMNSVGVGGKLLKKFTVA